MRLCLSSDLLELPKEGSNVDAADKSGRLSQAIWDMIERLKLLSLVRENNGTMSLHKERP